MSATRAKITPMSAAAAALRSKTLASPIEMCAPVRRIVTFHSGSLQELLFALPALRTLRETFEGAPLCAVVREGLAPLLEASALADEILTRPEGGLSSQAGLMAKLHAHHFDIALAFSTSRKSTLLTWSSGAPARVGFDGAKMDALFTHRIQKENSLPLTIEAFLDLTRAVGCAPRCFDYSELLRPAPQYEREAALLLEEQELAQPFILLAPQAELLRSRGDTKATSLVWAKTLSQLSQRWPVLLIGALPNRALLRQARELGLQEKVHDAGGALEVATLAALCGRARVFVGHAGGTAHLAAAMNTSVVAVCPQPKLREICEPRSVPYRMLDSEVQSDGILAAVRDLVGV